MNKTTSVFMTAAMAALSSFAAPQKAADITVSGYTGASTLENFPVLVRISPTRISGFSYADCAADGADVAFTDAQDNTLPREIDTWDTTGESLVWVRVPSLVSGTVITMTYKDPAVTAQPACQTDGSVWAAAGYAGVWHMNEASGAVADASGHGLTATPAGNTANSIAVTNAPIGTARQTATSTARGYLSIPNYNGLSLGNQFTISGWVYFTGVSGYPRLFSRKNNYTDANGWEIEMQNGSYTKFTARGIGNSSSVAGTIPTLQKKWVHLAFVYNGTSFTAFANGVQVATGTIQAATDNGLPLSIGCDSDGTESYVFGYFDECRLLGTPASSDWIAASYASQSDSAFLTCGPAYLLASDDLLNIAGEPAAIGAPTPAYGQITGLTANNPRTLSMAATIVPGEGTVTNYLLGWKLESVDVETAARTILRSSSDANEVFNRCDYVHAGCAYFTWLWDVRDALGVGAPTLVANGGNSLTFSADVTGIGYTAPSATLKFAYGVSPDALVYTNVASASVTEIGTVQTTLTHLTPSAVYYVKAVLETNDGARDTAESETISVQTDAIVENGEPGLWQTFFTSANAVWTKDIWAVPEGTDWKNYTDANRIRRRELTPIGAYLGGNPGATKYTSELWGDQVYWPANGGQWVYAGSIYLESSKSYKFRMHIDDNERIQITDAGTGATTKLLEDTASKNEVKTSASYTPSVTGWHAIEIRMSDGTGGAGGYNTSSSYKNSTNLGFSQDGGLTWSILTDPGDGSLLRAPHSLYDTAIEASEVVANGALASVSLAFDAVESARSLCVAWGPAHGGSDPADWYATNAVATVAAGATSATWTPPADWGSATNLVVRFYFDASPVWWSNSIFWRDYSAPSVTDVSADGTGGDTLAVSGTLDSFPGADCALTVYVGDSPTALDYAWTGLAGAVRTATGAFSLTLHEPDTTAARYLAPGETYYVTVQAVSGGQVSRTVPVAVTMKAAPAFASASASASVTRRTVAFTAALPELGMSSSATVTLYIGPSSASEGDLVAVEEPVVQTTTGAFTITHVFPAFETSYKWQLRAVSTAAGGTASLETRTAVGTVKTLDTTTYTWKASVSTGDWSNAANWTDNQGGDCLGYPQSSAASVVFVAGTVANVAFTEALTIGSLNLAANLDVTFSQGGASTNATKLTAGTITGHNNNTRGGTITLDGVAIASTSGDTLIDSYRSLRLVNGANLYLYGVFGQQARNDVLVADGSLLSCNGTYFGGGTLVISNATFWSRGNDIVGRNVADGHVVFQGDHPVWYHAATDKSFYSTLANANVQLDFLVPVGGYATAPLQAKATPSYFLGNNAGNAGSCALTVNVLDESPANFADATIATPLISWPTKGINKSMVLEGHLPAYGAATDDAFAWLAADAANPTNLCVTIVGSSHAGELQISGVPEVVESAELSPSYGYTALASNATRTCAAPLGYVYLSETKRALCTGWKLYDVDAATLARTLADSGDTSTATVTGTGLWRELEWQWRVEYLVSATAGVGGSVSSAEQWIADGETATVTATPSAGYGFASWSGDVTDEDRMKQTVTFTVDGRGYALTASFNAAYYVATDGDDENDGLSAATPLATIGEALSRGALHIYVAAGVYDVTDTLTVSTATTIEGTGSNRGAIIRYTKNIKGYSSAFVIRLQHEDAALRNLAVTTAASSSAKQFVRGVRMTGGLIDNCAITNCIVNNGSWENGGGAYMTGGIIRNTLLDRNSIYGAGGLTTGGGNLYMSGGLVDTCVIRRGGAGNRTNLSNAGIKAEGGVIRNCLIEGNTAAGSTGFAVSLRKTTMENCTIVGNSAPNATSGSALYVNPDSSNPVVIRNTIVWGNTTAGGLANWAVNSTTGLTAERIVTTPVFSGTANTDADPLFADFENGDYHPTLGSARNAGVKLDWMDLAMDIDGNPRIAEGTPDIGCHEYTPAGLDCSFDVAAGGALDSDTVTFTATVVGVDLSGLVYSWTITDSDGNETTRSGSNLATLVLALGPGVYSARLDVENGAHDTASYARNNVATVFPSHIYVDVNGANAMPFASYANGATNILDAVAFATSGTTIHVADGFYRYDSEIVLNDAIRIVSENGPTNTTFFCSRAPLGLRSVNLANSGAVVSGIAITGIDTDNPASGTHDVYRYDLYKNSGTAPGAQPSIGGVRITGAGGTVTNCFIINHRNGWGAGATIAGGTVVDCLFTNNWNYCTGGAGGAGGGIHVDGSNALVDRCTFLSNCVYYGSTSYGGGANVNAGTLRNCLFVGNQCTSGYGGNLAVRSSSAKVYHCTSVKGYGSLGNGGIYYSAGTLADCISYDNIGNGIAEDTEDPGFIDYPGNDFHLSNASPAIDAATSGMGGDLDLDHMPRVSGPAADKGCFEYDKSQFSIGISYSSESFFSDTPVILDALATPEGTVIDEAQTWWTFDGTEPSALNHDAVGSSVTNLFGLGAWTVRFKTVYGGQTYTVDKPEWFTRYGRTVYLVQENGGSAFPYGTPETAATNVNDAVLAAMDGAMILVGDGTFPFRSGVKYIGRNLVVRSQNGPDRTTFDAAGKNAMFYIRSGDWKVVIDGIRFVNGSGYVDGGAIRINDGNSVITNCVFDSCHASAYGGGGVFADAGTIVDCLFTNCWCGNGNGPVGAVVRATSASCLIDRCILLDSHYVHDAASVTRSALYVNNGTVRNTVVARSRITGEGGILATGSAKVQNCTVVDNVSEHTGYVAGIKVEGSATVKNTILWNNVNEADGARAEMGGGDSRFDHCFTGDPCLIGKRGREFLIRSNSPCRDAGVVESWMNGALDLYRQPRIDNPKHSVDIGASECQRTDGTMLIMR